MWTNSRSLALSRIIVLLFLVLLTAGALSLPLLLKWYVGYAGKSAAITTPALISLWACVPPAFIALLSLGRLLKNISREQVFVRGNIRALRAISWCCFAVAFVFLCFFFYYILGLIIAILAAFMGLILRIVKNVFQQAVELKEENDLTV
jgi:hypothetical protein